jgi:hypothetical protein
VTGVVSYGTPSRFGTETGQSGIACESGYGAHHARTREARGVDDLWATKCAFKQLNMDLRDGSAVDVPKLAQLCHTTEEVIAQGFVFGNFPAQPSECARVLRYCPECLRRGWHFALYQLKFISLCPIHQLPLQESCTTCGRRVPYQLTTAVFDAPFQCSHCQADLGPALRCT